MKRTITTGQYTRGVAYNIRMSRKEIDLANLVDNPQEQVGGKNYQPMVACGSSPKNPAPADALRGCQTGLERFERKYGENWRR
jgi:hypothetical protein